MIIIITGSRTWFFFSYISCNFFLLFIRETYKNSTILNRLQCSQNIYIYINVMYNDAPEKKNSLQKKRPIYKKKKNVNKNDETLNKRI